MTLKLVDSSGLFGVSSGNNYEVTNKGRKFYRLKSDDGMSIVLKRTRFSNSK